jgi:3' terminal RNA ribose 2'-O-methyltransferase Hen1
MLLTISTTHQPATDIGYLLHKNPDNLHEIELAFGKAMVFYPEATIERCTAALLLDIDPVGLVRKNTPAGENFALEQYVNDRPYVASSFMSVALSKSFNTLFSGKSKHRPELVDQAIPLEVEISALPCRGGEKVLRRLFEPLGYQVDIKHYLLDDSFPKWGNSNCFSVKLNRSCSLREFLIHLYVMMPVLDNDKHYWIDDSEVEKLLKFGDGWLADHPEKELITRRYLKNFRSLMNSALHRLSDGEIEEDSPEAREKIKQEDVLEKKINLNQQRILWVTEKLQAYGVQRLVDLGCGEGKLIRHLFKEKKFEQLTGCDVSSRALEVARERLHLDRLPEFQSKKIQFIQTALNYRDRRLAGYDAATLIEVIEHLDPSRLDALSRSVFEFAKPKMVIITTPNVEYNALFENLPPGKFRHSDHRFEWTRKEFQDWANQAAEKFGYQVSFESVGQEDELLGAPTQAGVFFRNE